MIQLSEVIDLQNKAVVVTANREAQETAATLAAKLRSLADAIESHNLPLRWVMVNVRDKAIRVAEDDFKRIFDGRDIECTREGREQCVTAMAEHECGYTFSSSIWRPIDQAAKTTETIKIEAPPF